MEAHSGTKVVHLGAVVATPEKKAKALAVQGQPGAVEALTGDMEAPPEAMET